MLFPYTPYETVAFVAEKLSFSGFRGLLLSELWQVIQQEFKQTEELDEFQKILSGSGYSLIIEMRMKMQRLNSM